MKVVSKKRENNVVTLECTASAQEVNEVLRGAQIEFAATMGLQPEGNKTVPEIAEEKLGIKNLDSVVEQAAINNLVPFAIDKKNIIPAFPPNAVAQSPFKRNQDFRFTMDVTLKPEYELTSYDPVEITVAPFTVDESVIDEQLKTMAEQYVNYVSAPDKVIENGDSALIALKVTEDGKEIKGLTTDGRPYTVGMQLMPEGFDDHLIGMQPGDTKTFTFMAPSTNPDKQGQDVPMEATITIKEIQQEQIPEINDEWVATYMPMYKDVSELREALLQQAKKSQEEGYHTYLLQMAAGALIERFEGKIADEIYEAAARNLIENIRGDLRQQGMSWETFVEQNGGDQQVNMMLMMQTRQMLVQGLALDSVFRHEKLSIVDADLEKACRTMNPTVKPKQFKEQLLRSGRGFVMREAAERMKANEWVLDHAIVHTKES